jgi:DNA-binding transcriptional MerR regulator
MANYTIKDLEKLSGIKAHTIRMWEKRYGLIAPTRTSTNIRTYCDNELKKLLNISILNRNGFKISRIADLSMDEINTRINQLTKNSDDTETQIENLAISMIDLDENKFEKIISRAIIQLGFEDMVVKIVYPFLDRIGIMWQTGTINPAQEHFVSNLIRQKLIVAIDSQVYNGGAHSKSFMLFLPEGELHELGLLFFSYLIKKRGHRIIYLGQSVPIDDLISVYRIRSVDYLLTSFVSSIKGNNGKSFIQKLSDEITKPMIYISGNQTKFIQDNLPKNFKVISSPRAFIDELNKISSL